MNKKSAKKWMQDNVGNHIDDCGEVNMTTLSESCCTNFGFDHIGGPLDCETHWIWDLAMEVSDWYENKYC